jgi:Tol biopolymer transport system component
MDRFDRIVLIIIGLLIAAITSFAIVGDRAGAGLVATSPPDGSSPAITTEIQIEFSQPMDQPEVVKRLTIEPLTPGSIHWDGSTLNYSPSQPLVAGQTYRVALSAGARSALGRIVNHKVEWSFTPRRPGAIYLTPVDANAANLWMIQTDGEMPREIYHTLHGIDSFAVRPDGSQIAVTVNGSGEAADTWLVDPWSGDALKVTSCAPDFCGRASWSPDGRRLAFEKRKSGAAGEATLSQIWLYDLASGVSSALFQDKTLPGYGPQWSPDGSYLAFFDPQAQAIDVVDLSSGKLAYLPSQMGDVGSFSPDGARMVYEDIRPVGGQVFAELWLGDLSGDPRVSSLVEQPEEDQFPAWSPDGRWIAFGRRRLDRKNGFGSQLMLLNPVTGELRQVSSDPAFNNTAFKWSPSGESLLVQRYNMRAASGSPEIWLHDLATNTFSALVTNAIDPGWLP